MWRIIIFTSKKNLSAIFNMWCLLLHITYVIKDDLLPIIFFEVSLDLFVRFIARCLFHFKMTFETQRMT